MTNQKEPKNINNAHKAFKFVLRWEGGDRYTNDPKDPGGETKYGISKRAHPTLDIKHLTPEKALEIYLEKYWFPSGADDLDFPMCLLVFDTAFLCGVGGRRFDSAPQDGPSDSPGFGPLGWIKIEL